MKWLILSTIIPLMACAHTQVVAFDREQNQVSVESKKLDAAQRLAEQYCGGFVRLLRMGDREVGSYIGAQAINNRSAFAVQKIKRRNVYTFSCSPRPTEQTAQKTESEDN